jgi:hypothetical protein
VVPGCGAGVEVLFGVGEDPVQPGEFAILLELGGDVWRCWWLDWGFGMGEVVAGWIGSLPSRPSALSPRPWRKMKAAPWAGSEGGVVAGL